MTPATFIQWMARHKFTNKAAAAALGISVSAVVDLRQGVTRSTGRPRLLDRRTELACMAVDAGLHKPKRCEPCRATGLVHCSDPENCGGPWDEHQTALQDVKAATNFLKDSK